MGVMAMTVRRICLLATAVACAALAAWSAAAVLGIYRDGMARRAEDPRESIYTPEIVAERSAPAAALFFIILALTAAGLAAGAGDGRGEKGAKDPEWDRDLIVSAAGPAEITGKERKKRLALTAAGWGLFAACMVPAALFVMNGENFPERDTEGMLRALLAVLLPWTAAGLAALLASALLRDKSFRREAAAARGRIGEAGTRTAPPAAGSALKGAGAVRMILAAAAAALILAGILNGGAWDVLVKAITICTECVGLG